MPDIARPTMGGLRPVIVPVSHDTDPFTMPQEPPSKRFRYTQSDTMSASSTTTALSGHSVGAQREGVAQGAVAKPQLSASSALRAVQRNLLENSLADACWQRELSTHAEKLPCSSGAQMSWQLHAFHATSRARSPAQRREILAQFLAVVPDRRLAFAKAADIFIHGHRCHAEHLQALSAIGKIISALSEADTQLLCNQGAAIRTRNCRLHYLLALDRALRPDQCAAFCLMAELLFVDDVNDSNIHAIINILTSDSRSAAVTCQDPTTPSRATINEVARAQLFDELVGCAPRDDNDARRSRPQSTTKMS